MRTEADYEALKPACKLAPDGRRCTLGSPHAGRCDTEADAGTSGTDAAQRDIETSRAGVFKVKIAKIISPDAYDSYGDVRDSERAAAAYAKADEILAVVLSDAVSELLPNFRPGDNDPPAGAGVWKCEYQTTVGPQTKKAANHER